MKRFIVVGAALAAALAACQLIAGIETIDYSADAAGAVPPTDVPPADGAIAVGNAKPCALTDGGQCVPSGMFVESQLAFCNAGALVRCGKGGQQCCPGAALAPGTSVDFCIEAFLACDSASHLCKQSCGKQDQPCCGTSPLQEGSGGPLIGAFTRCDVQNALTCAPDGTCKKCGGLGQPCCEFGSGGGSEGTSCGGGLCCDRGLGTCIDDGVQCTSGNNCNGHSACGTRDGGAAEQQACSTAGGPCCTTPDGKKFCQAGFACTPTGDTCVRCGGSDAPCCVGGSCNSGSCDSTKGTCSAAGGCGLDCGGKDQACCAQSTCLDTSCCDGNRCIGNGDTCANGDTCSNGTCACGVVGHKCCAGNTCTTGCCDDNGTCVGNGTNCTATTICNGSACVPCGDPGQACCGNQCNGNGCCDTNATCVADESACSGLGNFCLNNACAACGGPSEPCCSGSKKCIVNQCDPDGGVCASAL